MSIILRLTHIRALDRIDYKRMHKLYSYIGITNDCSRF